MSKENLSRRRVMAGLSLATAAGGGKCSARPLDSSAVGKLAVLGGRPVRKKPFPRWPQPTEAIERSLVAALRSGRWGRTLRGPMKGPGLVTEFERRFAELIGAKYCLATGSCTQSLHTALHAVGVGPGDEVLVPPCTFIASVQAILMCGALPVFVDVDLDTFQMDPDKIESRISAATRAIEPVHIAGLPCDMPRIMAAANRHGLKVVEDAAQAHLASINGKHCGTFGALGCFSFQSSKVMACGEGGAIVSDDLELIQKCYTFHNVGLAAVPGANSIGTKYRMNEFEAAVLLPQFATLPGQTERRNRNARYLAKRLSELPGIVPQKLSPGVERGAYYLYGFRYLSEHFNDAPRSAFVRALRAERIPCTTMYFDRLNTRPFLENALNSPIFRKVYGAKRLAQYKEANNCPVNDRLSDEGVWLPQRVFLATERDMDDIADAIVKLHANREQLAKLE